MNRLKIFLPSHAKSVLLAVVIVTMAILSITIFTQSSANKALFQASIDTELSMLKALVERDIEKIGSVANFFHTMPEDEWNRFDSFSEQVLGQTQSIIALEWFEKSTSRKSIEKINKLKLISPESEPFTFTQKGLPLEFDNIYIMTDITPRTKENIKLLGFYADTEDFQEVARYIETTKLPAISEKLELFQNDKSRQGVLLYYPVFDPSDNHMIGIVVGVLDIAKYTKSLLLQIQTTNDISIRISEINPNGSSSEFFTNNVERILDDLYYFESINIYNRVWGFELTKELSLTPSQWITLLIELFLSLLLALFAFMIVNILDARKKYVEEELVKKTKDLNYLAMHDSLTNLMNRRAFDVHLKEVLERKSRVSLAFIDLDNFKSINDNYGHNGGDEALIHLARILKTCTRSSDVCARLGGDEFAITIVNAEESKAIEVANRLCTTLANSPLQWHHQDIHATLSIGICTHTGEGEDEFRHRADVALYQAKERGKNQVVVYREPVNK
ncbi:MULTISPECIES: sensor domain-containing diguanylate cyclase [Vibrio]|uniref:diguanylate cyclase n=1 Tax=Vibrio cortegadensis TaxID=1328770 RepID=A0ABV4M966_9VIBR|nr:sensor domain-containing diguanylate cyclase [Vibrio sp. 03-59-1]NOH84687.1 sensor domain-containing diguanylate cyclase [Vibrio sp. 03-59-1]